MNPNFIMMMKMVIFILYVLMANILVIFGPNLEWDFHEHETRYQLSHKVFKIVDSIFLGLLSLDPEFTRCKRPTPDGCLMNNRDVETIILLSSILYGGVVIFMNIILTCGEIYHNNPSVKNMFIIANISVVISLIFKFIGFIFVYYHTLDYQVTLGAYSFVVAEWFFAWFFISTVFLAVGIASIGILGGICYGVYHGVFPWLRSVCLDPSSIFIRRDVILDN
jgi:hypothetical protein